MLFFTPVHGKKAFLKDWVTKKLKKDKAKEYKTDGIGIVHSLSGTCAFDLDNYSEALDKFNQLGIDFEEIVKGHCEIKSPKANTRKLIFKLPQGKKDAFGRVTSSVCLLHLNVGDKLELRTGNHYDVWSGSDYPGGGKYEHLGSEDPLELPEILAEFWIKALEYKENELKHTPNHTATPIYNGKKLSIIYAFNRLNSLESVLEQFGYTTKGQNKWKSPDSESGSYGVNVTESYLNPWDVCYSHHASDGELSNRPVDAFEIASAHTFPENDPNTAKKRFSAQQSLIIHPIDQETGEIMDKTIDEINNPAGNDLYKTIDIDWEKEPPIPQFKESIVSSLPEPIPFLLHNFKQGIFDPVPAMFCPAFMALHEVLLLGKVKTIRGRAVNCNYANGSLSGGGKDDNSVEASANYLAFFNSVLQLNLSESCKVAKQLLSPITTSFTSGTNLLQLLHGSSLTEDTPPLGGVLMDSEATAFFRNIGDTKNQYMGNAILDNEIQCFNGMEVTGSNVTADKKNHLKKITRPNFSFMRLTQLEPFKEALTFHLVEKGYYGRMFETFDTREDEKYIPSGKLNRKTFNYDTEAFLFIQYLVNALNSKEENIRVDCNFEGSPIFIWDEINLGKAKSEIRHEMFAGIKRIPEIAEKWCATITTYNYYWCLYNNKPVTHLNPTLNAAGKVIALDGSSMEEYTLPMCEYLYEVKMYTLSNFIDLSSLIQLNEAFQEIWTKCVQLTNKGVKINQAHGNWLAVGLVPWNMFQSKVSQKRAVKKYLGDDPEKINRVLSAWMGDKGLVKVLNKRGKVGSKTRTCVLTKT